jgi:sterol desaturase/sphingolipid hydroxylase (fatty acid hydroxylase superfamily)
MCSAASWSQHNRIRTPRWLGYIIQRPESHSHHHERGTHARNYSDLPIFELLFGTFHNPQDFATATGFYDGASARIVEMLRFRDVSVPRLNSSGRANLCRELDRRMQFTQPRHASIASSFR